METAVAGWFESLALFPEGALLSSPSSSSDSSFKFEEPAVCCAVTRSTGGGAVEPAVAGRLEFSALFPEGATLSSPSSSSDSSFKSKEPAVCRAVTRSAGGGAVETAVASALS